MTELTTRDQLLIRKLTDIILANLDNQEFGVSELIKESGQNRHYITRKLHELKNKNVNQFIREVRLQKALEMLKTGKVTASEVAYKVGFSSPAYFNTCFHELFGFTPGHVKKEELFDITEIKPPEVPAGHNQKKTLWRTSILILPGITLLGLLAYITYSTFLKKIPPDDAMTVNQIEKSIVVTPFKTLSNDPGNQSFADGIMENIINNLGRIKEFRVISRTTAGQFRITSMTIPEIAGKLKVNYVLEGSVQKQGNKIRINVQLIDARNDRYLWSQTFDRDITDIFAVQSEIAFQIADNLKATLTSVESEQIRKVPTNSIESYNYYLLGRYFLDKNPQEAILNRSIEYFKKSLEEDPGFALAYAGMARAYMYLAHYGLMPWEEGRTRTRELANEALKIDKTISDAHSILGNLARYDFKWEEAIKEFRLAIDYEPYNPIPHDGYAMILFATGNLNEARKQINIAAELDPLSLEVLETSALFYLNEGNVDEMGDELRKMQEIDSDNNHVYRLYHNFYIIKGDTLNAIRALRKACDTDPAYSELGVKLMNIINNSGYKTALEIWLNTEIENNNPIYAAVISILLNRKEEALTWLEKAFEERHSMVYNIYYAWPFKNLRSEPRFQAIIDKMGLSEYIKAHKSSSPSSTRQ